MNPQDIDWLSFIVTLLMLAIIAGVAGIAYHFHTRHPIEDEYQKPQNWGAK
jgi:heme/copper-type cytochrome/quinol oxidase subunit 2